MNEYQILILNLFFEKNIRKNQNNEEIVELGD